MTRNPYKLSDAVIKQLTKLIVRYTGELKQSILRFDEINALRAVETIYAEIDAEIRRRLRRLYRDRFLEMLLVLAAMGDKEAERLANGILGIPERAVDEVLDEPSEVLHYSYDTEIIRKRDRLKEALMSTPTKTRRQLEAEKALRQVLQMATWYSDIVSQGAELDALKAAGVQRVRWNIYGDERVCHICEGMDGNMYDIDKVPPRPHPRCRCYLTKV